MLPFLAIHNVVAWWQLTSANYVEHYGLLRARLPDGSYERCQPHHSWNTNHLFSGWTMFHLQRHSDHHSHPGRWYQSLRHLDDLPQLPNGYWGMFVVAWIPPLWFRLIDPRLVAYTRRHGLPINFDPDKRERLIARYDLQVA
jgi:alkane 1-monooxygenase